MRRILALLLVLVLLLSGCAIHTEERTNMASLTVYASQDCMVRDTSSTTNYNAYPYMSVGTQSSSRKLRSYLDFNFSSLPAAAEITSASLYLRQISQTLGSTDTLTFDLYRVTGSWSESTITWDTQPATEATATITGLSAPLLTTEQWVSWDITTLVDELITEGDTGIMLRAQSEVLANDYKSFYTKEGDTSKKAYIVINYNYPDPSKPILDSISTITDASKTFNWSDSTDDVYASSELYYEMQLSDDNGSSWGATQTSAEGDSSYTLNLKTFYSLETGEYYYNTQQKIRVRAKTPLWPDGGGSNYYSDWVTSSAFTVDYRLGVSAPSSLTPSDSTPYEGETIDFECGRPATYNTHDDDGTTNELTYYVQLDDNTDLANDTEAVTSATKDVSYTVGELTSGTSDLSTYVKAYAVDTEGQTSPYTSNVAITFKRFRVPIINISEVTRAETSITVSFVIDDTGFGGTQVSSQINKVQYNLNGAGWTDASLGSWTDLTNSFTVGSLTASTKGTIAVRAINNEPVVGLGDKTSAEDSASVTEFIPIFATLYDSSESQGFVFARALLIDNKSATGTIYPGDISIRGGSVSQGWIGAGETWTYSSVDDPTGVITIAGDVTSKYSYGMKIKFTNGGNTIYGKICADPSYSDPNTTIKFLHEIDPTETTTGSGVETDSGAKYLMANSAITKNYYSTADQPYGFPLSDESWSVYSILNSNLASNTPTVNVWYSPGFSKEIPIGKWRTRYRVSAIAAMTTTSHSQGVTLSTTTNSITNTEFDTMTQLVVPSSGAYKFMSNMTAEDELDLTTKDTYYLLHVVSHAAGGSITASSNGFYVSTGLFKNYGKIKATFID